MSTTLLMVADLEEFEELGYQQTRDRDALEKQICADYGDKRHCNREACTGERPQNSLPSFASKGSALSETTHNKVASSIPIE